MDRPYNKERDDRQTSNSHNTEPRGSAAAPPEVDQDEVRRRAYERFEARGGAHGNDQADWFEAEREVRDHARTRPGGGGGSEPPGFNRPSEESVTSGRPTRGRGFHSAPIDERNTRASSTGSTSSPPENGREAGSTAASGGPIRDRVRDTGIWLKRMISDR